MNLEQQEIKCKSCSYVTDNKKSISNHLRFGCNQGIPWHKKDYQNRKEYWKERSKNRYTANKEEELKKRKLRYASNPEKEKKQTQRYAQSVKGKAVRKSAWHRYRTQKSKGNVTSEQMMNLFKQQLNCKKCNSIEHLEIDHIIPLSKGGKHEISNLQLLCRKCNRSKGNKIWN